MSCTSRCLHSGHRLTGCLRHTCCRFPTGSGADPQALSFGDMDGDGLQDAFLTKWDWYTGSHISNPTLSFRSNRVSTGLAPRGFSDPPTALETTMQAFLDKLAQPGFIRPVDLCVRQCLCGCARRCAAACPHPCAVVASGGKQ